MCKLIEKYFLNTAKARRQYQDGGNTHSDKAVEKNLNKFCTLVFTSEDFGDGSIPVTALESLQPTDQCS